MKGFSTLDNPSHEGQTNTWLTPLDLINNCGEFDYDPCGFDGHRTAKKINVLPSDGLRTEWEGNVWLNPPYGREIQRWLSRLEEHANGVALLFSRTDTRWFQSSKPDMILYLAGRVKFLRPDFTADTNAGHGSMLFVYGNQNVWNITQAVLDGRIKGKMMRIWPGPLNFGNE